MSKLGNASFGLISLLGSGFFGYTAYELGRWAAKMHTIGIYSEKFTERAVEMTAITGGLALLTLAAVGFLGYAGLKEFKELYRAVRPRE